MSIIKNVTLQKIVAHDFRYVPRKCLRVFLAVCKELVWGILGWAGNAFLSFPFKIVSNSFLLSDFSLSGPFFGTNERVKFTLERPRRARGGVEI